MHGARVPTPVVIASCGVLAGASCGCRKSSCASSFRWLWRALLRRFDRLTRAELGRQRAGSGRLENVPLHAGTRSGTKVTLQLMSAKCIKSHIYCTLWLLVRSQPSRTLQILSVQLNEQSRLTKRPEPESATSVSLDRNRGIWSLKAWDLAHEIRWTTSASHR